MSGFKDQLLQVCTAEPEILDSNKRNGMGFRVKYFEIPYRMEIIFRSEP